MNSSVDIMVGRRLRARRRLLGYSQQNLGQACGVTFQQIHKYEAAVCRMSAVMLWKLSQVLEVDVGYFFGTLTDDEISIARRHDLAMSREIPREMSDMV
ncbi:helix-turn-helix transcriptional regulator [Phenylobacterium sp.]|uniref:helix-turn-helix domain-containing protein n=1 Tax=Phenylobacterium sp. TaxID=1871053 RepID=UPI002E352E21|nr:helix-turn-helix transcriptional regulator [Phenylobacterium sp.]HEX3364730.1 helix-turn-helix transcriptional regulator [Phenylobacterium sp.]